MYLYTCPEGTYKIKSQCIDHTGPRICFFYNIYILLRVNFTVQVCNHPLALDIIFFAPFLNFHPCFMVHAVNLITNSMGSMHRLFHFTCVVQFKLTNSESSLQFFALISDFFVSVNVNTFPLPLSKRLKPLIFGCDGIRRLHAN